MDRALAEREDQPLGLIGAGGGEGESAAKLDEMKEEMDVSMCSFLFFICVGRSSEAAPRKIWRAHLRER